MESLEISAPTLEEAIKRALEQLGVSREEVEITVVNEGKSGIMGMGAEDATIIVRPLTDMPEERNNIVTTAKDVLETLLTKMGVTGSIVPPAKPFIDEEADVSAPITLDIKGEDLGILIGRRGQTLSCLQYIVRLIVGHQTKTWLPIIIDVEGYKQRRYEALRALAWRIAEQVKASGTLFTLEPMPAFERRIIHLALVNHPDVTTQSINDGEARRVVVLPIKQRPISQDI